MKHRDPLNISLTVISILVFAFLFLPIIVIVVYSFNSGQLLASWQGFGVEAYQRAVDNPVIRSAVINSLLSAAGAALVATILGTLGGIALARSNGRRLWVILFGGLLALTLLTPEIIDAVSLLPWFVSLGTDLGLAVFNGGLLRLIIAHSIISTAVVTFIVRARMQGIDASLEEAAQDLYANRWQAFWQVTFPMARPGVLAGSLMAFTLSLDNTIVSSFVQVPGSTPWPVYIFSSIKRGLKPEVAAVSTVMLILTLVVLAVVALVLRRGGGSSENIAATMAGQ